MLISSKNTLDLLCYVSIVYNDMWLNTLVLYEMEHRICVQSR